MMDDENDYSDIEDLSQVRAEQDYFKRLCFFHQMKITNLITANIVAGKGLEHYQIYAIYLEILNFETDLEGLLDEKYWAERNVITESLEGIENKNNRKNYLETLMKWKRLLIARLARRTDYLPSIHASLMIDNGFLVEETNEPKPQAVDGTEGEVDSKEEEDEDESNTDEAIQQSTPQE